MDFLRRLVHNCSRIAELLCRVRARGTGMKIPLTFRRTAAAAVLAGTVAAAGFAAQPDAVYAKAAETERAASAVRRKR